MNRTVLVLAALAALATSACADRTRMASSADSAPMATTATDFLPTAAAANTFEIETSRLALTRSRDPAITTFANQMIQDHSAAAARMEASVRTARMVPPPAALDAEHQALFDQLAAAPAGQFDPLYVQMQVQAHQDAVALFTAYGQRGDNPTLVAFAQETLPTLRMHQQQIQAISSRRR